MTGHDCVGDLSDTESDLKRPPLSADSPQTETAERSSHNTPTAAGSLSHDEKAAGRSDQTHETCEGHSGSPSTADSSSCSLPHVLAQDIIRRLTRLGDRHLESNQLLMSADSEVSVGCRPCCLCCCCG
jgi:hypothetical protein